MRSKAALIFGLVAALAIAVPLAGCGEKEGEEAMLAVEGEPLHIGHAIYNVAITRFLNPDEVEDAAYLEGQPDAPVDKSYLGVFLTIKNESDEEIQSATNYEVTDANDRLYELLESESPFSLDVGASVPPDGEIPEADTIASEGVIQGAMLLFLVDDDVSAARPLELEIEGPDGTGHIELDI